MELTRRGIPYEIRSGIRFFEQRHVKDVLAFLRILVESEGRALLEARPEALPEDRRAHGRRRSGKRSARLRTRSSDSARRDLALRRVAARKEP